MDPPALFVTHFYVSYHTRYHIISASLSDKPFWLDISLYLCWRHVDYLIVCGFQSVPQP